MQNQNYYSRKNPKIHLIFYKNYNFQIIKSFSLLKSNYYSIYQIFYQSSLFGNFATPTRI